MKYRLTNKEYSNLESLYFYSFLIKHRRNTENDCISFNKTRRTLIRRLDKGNTPWWLINIVIQSAEDGINFVDILDKYNIKLKGIC